MSYILDALKKSETDRQRQDAPGIADVPSPSRDRKTPGWIWLLVGLLLINAVVLGGMLFRGDAPKPVAATPSTIAPAASTDLPPPETIDTATVTEEPAIARREPVQAAAPNPRPVRNAPPESAPMRPATTPVAENSALTTLMELRANGTVQLPDLHLDVHVYSSSPSDRFVFINMSKYRERSRLTEGPMLTEIRQDGAVLEYQGHTFLLPRE